MAPCVELIMNSEQSDTDNHRVMQQFGASAFYTVVHWHKLRKMDSEYLLHNSIVLAICVPKIIKFGKGLTKFWQKQVGSYFGSPYIVIIKSHAARTP